MAGREGQFGASCDAGPDRAGTRLKRPRGNWTPGPGPIVVGAEAGGSGAALGAEGRALERIQAGPGRAVMAARAGRGTGRGRGVAERSAAWLCVVSSPALHSSGRCRPASRPGDEDLPASPARQPAAAAAAGRLHCLTTARAGLSAGKPAGQWLGTAPLLPPGTGPLLEMRWPRLQPDHWLSANSASL